MPTKKTSGSRDSVIGTARRSGHAASRRLQPKKDYQDYDEQLWIRDDRESGENRDASYDVEGERTTKRRNESDVH